MQLRTPARRSGSHRVNAEPLRPVAAQVKKILEVNQAEVLQLINHVAEGTFGVNWSYHDEIPFHSKLVGCETESIVEVRSRESVVFERCATYEERRLRVR